MSCLCFEYDQTIPCADGSAGCPDPSCADITKGGKLVAAVNDACTYYTDPDATGTLWAAALSTECEVVVDGNKGWMETR